MERGDNILTVYETSFLFCKYPSFRERGEFKENTIILRPDAESGLSNDFVTRFD